MPIQQQDAVTRFDGDLIIPDVPLEGGVRNDRGPRHIGVNEAVEMLNVDIEDPTKLVKRKGYDGTGVRSVGVTAPAGRAGGLGELRIGQASRLIVASQAGPAGGIYYTPNPDYGAGWLKATVRYTATSGGTGHSVNVDTDEPVFFQGNGLLWIIPGSSVNVHAMNIRGELLDLGSSPSSPPKGAVDGTYMLERVWLLKDDWLYWSKLLPEEGDLVPDATAFPVDGTGTGGGRVQISRRRGTLPTAIVPWKNRSLIVFYRDSVAEFIVDSSNPVNSILNILEDNVGCYSRKSIFAFGSEILFLDNQYEIRSLAETISGQQRGIPLTQPITDRIRYEFPGRLNKDYSHLVKTVLFEGRLWIFYPRDSATSLSHALVYDPTDKRFEIMPAAFAHGFADVMPSDTSGSDRLYFLQAVPFDLYVSGSGSKDLDQPIAMQATLRAWDLGEPWRDKIPVWGRMEVSGDIGVKVQTWMRTDENDSFSRIRETEVTAEGDFPLVYPTDFPLTYPDDFPLTYSAPAVRRDKFSIERTHDVGLPVDDGDLPLYARDLPVESGVFGVNRGPIVQVRFYESSKKAVAVEGYRFAVTLLDTADID